MISTFHKCIKKIVSSVCVLSLTLFGFTQLDVSAKRGHSHSSSRSHHHVRSHTRTLSSGKKVHVKSHMG